MSITIITNENFEQEVTNSEEAVLLDFYADWCGPCKMMSPVLDQVSEREDIKVCKVNVEDAAEISAKFGIRGIPVLMVFKDGEQSGVPHVGSLNLAKLNEFIDERIS